MNKNFFSELKRLADWDAFKWIFSVKHNCLFLPCIQMRKASWHTQLWIESWIQDCNQSEHPYIPEELHDTKNEDENYQI